MSDVPTTDDIKPEAIEKYSRGHVIKMEELPQYGDLQLVITFIRQLKRVEPKIIRELAILMIGEQLHKYDSELQNWIWNYNSDANDIILLNKIQANPVPAPQE